MEVQILKSFCVLKKAQNFMSAEVTVRVETVLCLFFKSGYCLLAFCLILVPQSFHESLPEVTFNLKKLKLTDLSTFGMTFTLVGRGRE